MSDHGRADASFKSLHLPFSKGTVGRIGPRLTNRFKGTHAPQGACAFFPLAPASRDWIHCRPRKGSGCFPAFRFHATWRPSDRYFGPCGPPSRHESASARPLLFFLLERGRTKPCVPLRSGGPPPRQTNRRPIVFRIGLSEPLRNRIICPSYFAMSSGWACKGQCGALYAR